MQRSYSVDSLSRRTGIPVPTIRYYGEIGLLSGVSRGPGGHHYYTEDHLKHLQFVRRSRKLGFSLDEIQALLASGDQGDARDEDVDRLAQRHLQEVRAKIEYLIELEQMIASRQDDCGASCPIDKGFLLA